MMLLKHSRQNPEAPGGKLIVLELKMGSCGAVSEHNDPNDSDFVPFRKLRRNTEASQQ